jgi:hypothetical protein
VCRVPFLVGFLIFFYSLEILNSRYLPIFIYDFNVVFVRLNLFLFYFKKFFNIEINFSIYKLQLVFYQLLNESFNNVFVI